MLGAGSWAALISSSTRSIIAFDCRFSEASSRKALYKMIYEDETTSLCFNNLRPRSAPSNFQSTMSG